jgi:hypothetical protein
MMMVILIDGAIAAQQAESSECREIPLASRPGVRQKRLFIQKAERSDRQSTSECNTASKAS